MKDLPLGQPSAYPEHYDPTVMRGIARADARRAIGVDATLPFHGVDVWNAWELSWLDANGKPVVATAEIHVDCASPKIVESKSLKLYLTSLANAKFSNTTEIETTLVNDLRPVLGSDPAVIVVPLAAAQQTIAEFPGNCVDDESIGDIPTVVDASELRANDAEVVEEELHTHLLRSLCPVTGQPDTGSLLIRYRGPAIDRAALLRYLVSFRNHNDFHEACVERIFMALKERCRAERLSVYARYTRRGGIDINPFRSDFETTVINQRLWRQ